MKVADKVRFAERILWFNKIDVVKKKYILQAR